MAVKYNNTPVKTTNLWSTSLAGAANFKLLKNHQSLLTQSATRIRLISTMNKTSKSGCDGQHVLSSAGMLKLKKLLLL